MTGDEPGGVRVDPIRKDRPVRILLVAYRFPPQGGSGVQRPAKMVKVWHREGHEVRVLTTRADAVKVQDDALLADVPDQVEVVTAPDPSPGPAVDRVRQRLRRTRIGAVIDRPLGYLQGALQALGAPDARAGWLFPAVERILSIHREFRPDVIVATGPPWTPALAAALASRLTGVPLVIDYRDPWTGTYFGRREFFLARHLNPHLERFVLATASGVAGAHREVLRRLRPMMRGRRPLRQWIPNGFDPDDIPEVAARPDPGVFTLTYTGGFFTLRNPRVFIETLESLLDEGVIAPERFRLRLAGTVDLARRAMRDDGPLLARSEIRGYVSHDESVALLRESTANLILEVGMGGKNHHSPGKVYEVFACARPVLLLCPDGVTPHLGRRLGATWIAPPEDPAAIRAAIVDLYRAWDEGRLTDVPDSDHLRFYERGYQGRRMLRLLQRVIDRG